jgi:hypothetical protein
MSKLLPPFHKPMHSTGECDLANDRIACLEMELKSIGESWRKAGERIVVLEAERDAAIALHDAAEADADRLRRLFQRAKAAR